MTPANCSWPPSPRPVPRDRQKVRDALANIPEFEGVTGKMKFTGTGDPAKSAVILQIKDGKFAYFTSVSP